MLEMGRIEPARDERNTVYVEHSPARPGRQRPEVHPHRILIDLMKVVQRDHKLDSYTSTPWLSIIGDKKDDVSVGHIPTPVRTDTDRATVASYCIQDSSNFLCENSPPWLEVSEWRRSVPSHAAGFSCVVRVRKSCHWSPSSASATTSPSLSSVDKPRPAN
jgi:hypothetical protein